MWLLKLHFAFSILCIITFFGVMIFMKDVLKRNGYMIEIKGKKNIRNYLRILQLLLRSILKLFIPFLNVVNVIAIFVMIGIPIDELMKHLDEKQKDELTKKLDKLKNLLN